MKKLVKTPKKTKKRTPKYYKSPLSKGKRIFVPVVHKNRDSLVGYIDGCHSTSSIVGIEILDWSVLLSSERLNDITIEDKKLSQMTKKELTEYIKNIILYEHMKHSSQECTQDVLSEYYFHVSCKCGNFMGFRSPEEIPSKNLKCTICDRILIHYTGIEEIEYIYDGKDLDIDNIIIQAREELGIESPIDPEEDDEE